MLGGCDEDSTEDASGTGAGTGSTATGGGSASTSGSDGGGGNRDSQSESASSTSAGSSEAEQDALDPAFDRIRAALDGDEDQETADAAAVIGQYLTAAEREHYEAIDWSTTVGADLLLDNVFIKVWQLMITYVTPEGQELRDYDATQCAGLNQMVDRTTDALAAALRRAGAATVLADVALGLTPGVGIAVIGLSTLYFAAKLGGVTVSKLASAASCCLGTAGEQTECVGPGGG